MNKVTDLNSEIDFKNYRLAEKFKEFALRKKLTEKIESLENADLSIISLDWENVFTQLSQNKNFYH